MQPWRGDLLILLAAAIWGVAFYFQKTAMLHIGPLLFIGLRGAVAALVLLPFAIAEQHKSDGYQPKPTGIAAAAGGIFFVAAAIQQYGIVTTTVTNTGFLTALYVVATPFIYWAYQQVVPAAGVWLAVSVATLGIVLLGGGNLGGLNQGDLLVASSALIWALLIVVTGAAARYAQPLTYTCLQFAWVAALGVGSALWLEPVQGPAIIAALDAVIYVGALSSALTFGIMAVALQHIPAPRATVLLSSEVVFSALAGYLLLDEVLPAISWLGAGLILLAIVVARRTRPA